MSGEHDTHELEEQTTAESQADKAKRLKLQLDDDDIQWLMSDKRGRRLMWRQLLEPAGVFRNAYDLDAGLMAFKCGEQNAGHRLMAKLHRLCPGLYFKMVSENSRDG
jgi:hypothetical protein